MFISCDSFKDTSAPHRDGDALIAHVFPIQKGEYVSAQSMGEEYTTVHFPSIFKWFEHADRLKIISVMEVFD